MASMPPAQRDESRWSQSAFPWLASRTARSAVLGMVVVLISLSGFVLWASLHTAQVTKRVVAANKLSTDFNAAQRANKLLDYYPSTCPPQGVGLPPR